MDLGLEGKVAVVTGGATGLGAAITTLFAKEGCNVVVNYVVGEEDTFRFVDGIVAQTGTKCIPVYGDISKAEDMQQLVGAALKEFGKIDILVNNAGIWPTSPVKDMSDDEWRRTIDIDLTGTFMISKRVVQYMLGEGRPGRIINIVSQAAFHGSTSGHAHYAAAKAGVVGFTVSLAREVAKYGINVTAVAPGMMKTEMVAGALKSRPDDYNERIPIGRVAEPREVGNAVLFLASALGDYVVGATIDVSGGMLMR